MIYADTSFLAALYVPREDTGKAADYAGANDLRLPFLFLHWPEMAKSIFDGKARNPDALWTRLKTDLAAGDRLFSVLTDADGIGQRAAGLMRHFTGRWPRLRALDVMHVSAAVHCQAKWFLSFDAKSDQRILATTQKLKVWPPLSDEERARLGT